MTGCADGNGSLGQQTATSLTSRALARQNRLVPAGRSERGRASKGHFSPSFCAVNYCETVVVLAQQPEGWDRWAGTAGPPTAPGLLVGEALVPDGWEDSVGIEL